MDNIKLSILIPSVPSRRKTFLNKILDQIEGQINNRRDIEVLVLYDNKLRTLGEKRTDLLNIAKGEYTVFIDDDDRISEDYIEYIMYIIDNKGPVDCIVFDSICSYNGVKIHAKYGIEYEYNRNNSGEGFWTGKPAHTMVYSSSISKTEPFIYKTYGEDSEWVSRVWPKIKTQVRINKVLYYYDFNPATTETRHSKYK